MDLANVEIVEDWDQIRKMLFKEGWLKKRTSISIFESSLSGREYPTDNTLQPLVKRSRAIGDSLEL